MKVNVRVKARQKDRNPLEYDGELHIAVQLGKYNMDQAFSFSVADPFSEKVRFFAKSGKSMFLFLFLKGRKKYVISQQGKEKKFLGVLFDYIFKWTLSACEAALRDSLRSRGYGVIFDSEEIHDPAVQHAFLRLCSSKNAKEEKNESKN